jgi:hypothetical protein
MPERTREESRDGRQRLLQKAKLYDAENIGIDPQQDSLVGYCIRIVKLERLYAVGVLGYVIGSTNGGR